MHWMTSDLLLDANVLIALTVQEHEHHERSAVWAATVDRFAVCPIVEGALVRFLVRLGESAAHRGRDGPSHTSVAVVRILA